MKNVIMEKPKLVKKKKIKKENPEEEGFIPFEKTLSQKIDFNYDKSVRKLIKDILENERIRKIGGLNVDNLFIFLNPVKENLCEFLTQDLFKFLVFLKRKNIIIDLHLPLSIRKANVRGKVYSIMRFSPEIITEAEDIIDLAVKYQKNIRPYTIHFKVKDWDKLHSIYDKLEKQNKKKQEKEVPRLDESFEIQIKDREIWVNNYLLSKPHAVGSNLEFFEYICSQPPNTRIERKNLPDFSGFALKEQIKKKSFIKILNELGFKGEILKAFFPKRGKNIVVYRGNKITTKDLEKSGIKMLLFFKELELAHIKNNPE